MAADGPGDHRLTDVINYNTPVYGKEADDLPKALASLMSRGEPWQWVEKPRNPVDTDSSTFLRRRTSNPGFPLA
jgi:hypothetical protein